MSKPKYLITQSLLSDYAYVFQGEDGYDGFLKTLHREKKPQTAAMLDGIRFENLVTACAEGCPPEPGHKWERAVQEVAQDCRGGQFQVKLSREIRVEGLTLVCYGILDNLNAGHILDIKFSRTYAPGKYLDSPQHPMYFYLCPEARDFTYLVSDGSWVYRERYTPDGAPPVEHLIAPFLRWLARNGLIRDYMTYWKAN